MVRVFEFLNKYPDRHLEVRDTEIDVSEFTKGINYDRIREDMHCYYPDAVDVWDPKWPGPKGSGVNVVIFTDASYKCDLVSLKSKTGVLTFLGSNLNKSTSKMQRTVADSTYSAEMAALGRALDEGQDLVYTLRFLGVKVNMPIKIFTNSKSVFDNISNPGSPLKKRRECVVYHRTREGIAIGFLELHHCDGSKNPSDINTKVTIRDTLVKHSGNVMYGQALHR